MLAAVQQALQALPTVRSDSDFARLAGDVARRFGFRSAFIIKYSNALREFERCIDTDAQRLAWWPYYFTSDVRPALHEVLRRLGSGPVLRTTKEMHVGASDRARAELMRYDLIEVTNIPVSYEQAPVGVLGFSGAPELTVEAEMALQVIAYALFAQLKTLDATPKAMAVALTPREREVVMLSAEGLTSVEIAERLGMSARTANQHIDNVAAKLGTRNRAHTVAEAIRHHLLN
jgi:DNA-binding CsgD family transcriptional regulator